jgi:hypothetical protein
MRAAADPDLPVPVLRVGTIYRYTLRFGRSTTHRLTRVTAR